MSRYKVEVIQRNVFWIDDEEAQSIEEAKLVAIEGRVWGEDQTGKDTYTVDIVAEVFDDA
jgi:hypothetical protein|tara:strand:+ start:1086 stop:1265 length:180 start_codon:yes stop_codon:yes gene_type:complete